MECFAVYSNEIEGRLDVESNLKRVKSSKDFLNFDNFHVKKLGEIAKLKRGPFGSSIKKEIFVEKSPDSYQVYEQYNAINNNPEWARYFISEKDFQRLNSFSVQENDILMSCSGTIGKLTVIPKEFNEGVINQALLRIRLNKDVNLKYFIIIFRYIIERLIEGNEFAYGSAIRNVVSVKELKKIQIPLPPLSIQNHIVQIMDNAYKIKKQKESVATQLLGSFEYLLRDEKILDLKKITQKKMFSINLNDLDGAFNPERYANQIQFDRFVDWIKINNIGQIYRDTFTPEKTNPENIYSLMRIDDLTNNPISAVTRNVKGKDVNGTILKVQTNDVLIARLGPTIENRKFILAPKSNFELISSNEFICLRCNEKNNPYFILHLLKTDFYKKLMIQKTRGATPSRRRLSHKDFGELPFPQIDISIQNKIAEEVKRRMQKAERLQKEAKHLLKESKEKVEKIILSE
jgi:restriction endonuclease S subunit